MRRRPPRLRGSRPSPLRSRPATTPGRLRHGWVRPHSWPHAVPRLSCRSSSRRYTPAAATRIALRSQSWSPTMIVPASLPTPCRPFYRAPPSRTCRTAVSTGARVWLRRRTSWASEPMRWPCLPKAASWPSRPTHSSSACPVARRALPAFALPRAMPSIATRWSPASSPWGTSGWRAPSMSAGRSPCVAISWMSFPRPAVSRFVSISSATTSSAYRRSPR